MIRAATAADVAALAAIHSRALPGDLLPRLGVRYLRDVFYPSALRLPGVDVWVATSDEAAATAFVVFAQDANALTGELRRRWPALLTAVARVAWRDPGIVLALIAVMKGSVVRLQSDAPSGLSSASELYVIATDPAVQGQGAGSQLTRHGLKHLATRGCRDCVVRTASPDALRFYRRLGFRTIGHELRGRRRLELLHITPADVRM